MIIGNKLHKLDSQGEVTKLTTDDIPEGVLNKYAIEYADGKTLGDLVLRPDPKEINCHSRLNGQIIYKYQKPSFYEWCLQGKEKAQEDEQYEFFNKTLDEYNTYLSEHVEPNTQENYCPYFVLATETNIVYQVTKNEETGYIISEEAPLVDIEIGSGPIYKDKELTEIKDKNPDDWFYNGVSQEVQNDYVKLPTLPSYLNGNNRLYYFIITNSRVNDDTNSIRTVEVGNTVTIPWNEKAYVRNVGTIQNLLLEFGIPEGTAATVEVGNVTEGDNVSITNSGDAHKAILDFTLPRGPQGLKGEKGDGATIGIGNVTDGENATVTNTGTPTDAVLDFVLPKGEAATLQVGTVKEGDTVTVRNSGTPYKAVLDFTLPRGPQGIAGGTVTINGIVDTLPASGNLDEKLYNSTNNKIYNYNGTTWVEYSNADQGLIYLYNNEIYHYDGTQLTKVSSDTKIDDLTITKDELNKLQVVGIINKQGAINYNWIGTLADWTSGRANHTIPDDYICFVIDD